MLFYQGYPADGSPEEMQRPLNCGVQPFRSLGKLTDDDRRNAVEVDFPTVGKFPIIAATRQEIPLRLIFSAPVSLGLMLTAAAFM
ncbi:hypothetical protein LZ554_008723 [Drepanopeziza brunnea f. sp. 'monogermtubi']|nr:hypothetical protein LZ554_008723 [Drepanopeziza brunnea f. sp. 'monogermtubi']